MMLQERARAEVRAEPSALGREAAGFLLVKASKISQVQTFARAVLSLHNAGKHWNFLAQRVTNPQRNLKQIQWKLVVLVVFKHGFSHCCDPVPVVCT